MPPFSLHTGLVCVCIFVFPQTVLAQSSFDEFERCYLDEIRTAAPSTTVAELQALCEPGDAPTRSAVTAAGVQDVVVISETSIDTSSRTIDPQAVENKKKDDALSEGSSFSQQIAAERQSLDRSYSLTPHNPNYLLAYSLRNNPNRDNQPEAVPGSDGKLDKQEAVLQISVKFPLWRTILSSNNDLMFSYTSKSWFQAYNSALSKPFRETNYEPEIFLRHYDDIRLPLGIQIAGLDLGYNHQSNGRSEPLSRSWDRIMARIGLDVTPSLSVGIRGWYRIPESAETDDNPDIHQYLGYGDFRAIWTPNKNTFTAMVRPGTRESGFEFTWSYPITKHFRLFSQYYHGYGESLIDYDQKVDRIGIGFTINDYLQVQ